MIYVFEDQQALNLEPLTLTRATFELRCGAVTHLERIRRVVGDQPLALVVRPQLAAVVQERYPDLKVNPDPIGAGLWMNGAALWDLAALKQLSANLGAVGVEGRLTGGNLTAGESQALYESLRSGGGESPGPVKAGGPRLMGYLWDHIAATGEQLSVDFGLWYRSSPIPVPPGVKVLGNGGVFLGKGVTLDPFTVLDTRNGPVIIEENTAVASHVVIAGPSYLGAGCQVKPGSILAEVILGPVCKVGGQVEETIMQGYSNKQHDGFLGHAYLGSWVNLGAGTTISDLKNNYSEVKVNVNGKLVNTGSLLVGLFMGDHAKSAIGTLFYTGTRVGVAANVFGDCLPPKVVPSFAWGCDGGQRYDLENCLTTMELVKGRRGEPFTDAERELWTGLYEGEG